MGTAENKGFLYEFGRFVLDPSERTLYCDGVPIHLPAKEFDTLLLLVEHNGQALKKEEMMEAIWDDAFVEESNLAKQISRLRKLLEGNGQKYIETIPKHGYRFNAELRRIANSVDDAIVLEKKTIRRVTLAVDHAEADPQIGLLPGKAGWFAHWKAIAVGLIVFIGIGSVWFWIGRTPPVSDVKKTIAILPIRSLSGDEGEKILAAGIGDALITKLAGLKDVVVRPGSSVSHFTEANRDPLEIGKNLDVHAVLDGTLLQADGKLRLSLRLVDPQTGVQMWTDKFDAVAGNVFDLEDLVSEKVARAILPTVSNGRVTKRYTEIPAAYDDFIKGKFFLGKRTAEGFKSAIGYFTAAAAKDPQYSLAYAGLADCYILLGVWGTFPPNEVFPKAREAANHALSIDPELSEALVSLAFVEWVNGWDFKQSDADFKRAIDLNPNYATAHHWYSYFLVSQGRNDEAIAHINKARELEGPLTVSVNTDIGEIFSWAGRYDEAEGYLREVLKIEPNYAVAHHVLGINLVKQNRLEEAIAEEEIARKLESESRVLAALGHAYALNGNTGRARDFLSELEATSRQKYVSQFSRAVILAGLGEKEAALDCLEKEYDERSDTMAIINVHPLLDSLHNESRFKDLLKRVGYDQ